MAFGLIPCLLVLAASCGGDSHDDPVATSHPTETATPDASIAPSQTPQATATTTPAEEGLSPVQLAFPSPGPVTVWVYAGTPVTPNCDNLLASMIPSELFASATPKEKMNCLPGNARYKFLQDSSGTYYIESVGILPIGLSTLPQSPASSSCEDKADYLVPASADPATAAYVLVCNDHLAPRDATPKTRQIWVRIVKPLIPATLPDPSEPCWQTSRYLGSYTEAETIEIQCTLDE